MGVHGLWKLLAPTGKPVTLESLEGKVLAVDVSIWLNQAMYGMQGYQATRANAHLVVLFNRICKLLHYKIKPIFVFDGVAPELKKHTLNARRKRKELAEARAKRATDRIVKNYLKSHALNELSKDSQSTKGKKPNLSRMLPKSEKDASIFELPPLPEDTKQRSRTILDEKEDMYLDRIDQQEAVEAQFDDINDIDINSEEFRCLPEEIQHEVITNIRESRKKPFWSRFKELPKKADDFSSYQLSRLLKKGKMSHRLDELQKDMKTKTSGDLAVLLDYETRLQAFEAGRVASEDAQHYLLIKNKPQNEEKKESDAEDENEMEVNNFDQKRPPLEGDYKTLEVMSRMEAGDDEWSGKYGDFGQAKTIADGGHHLPSSTRLAATESAETRRKNQIRHEVLQFFREYNTSVKGQKNDNKVDSDEKLRKKRKSNLIVDEEELRGLDKRKEDQSSTSPKKKRRHEKITVVEEVEDDRLKVKDVSVKKTPKSQQQQGFLGQSDVNLSDEYDSDQEKELTGEKSRSDVVTERIIEDDCTREDKHSEGTPVKMDVNVVEDIPSIQARTLVDSDTEGISVMEDEILMLEDKDGREKEEQEEDKVKEIDREGSVTGQDITKVTEDAENSEHSGEFELLPSEEPRNDELLNTNIEESENNATMLDESATSSKESTFMFNQEDFHTMQEKLDLERLNLEKDRGKDQRMSASVTEAMYNETKELLNLFGIPYIESPQEAEAQCAFLDLSGQCQGIITDDSDVWLFGGQRVYKNFFTKDRDVLFYHDQAIERQLTLDRYKLINMALLMGSDYTIGIQGVGFVTALEIMSEFSGDGIEGLERFRKWWEDANNEDLAATEAKIRSKLCKVILPSDFPNHVVVRAYLDPEVDKSKEKFIWNSPDLDLLRTYTMEKMGWIQSKTDEILLPVLKRFREKVVQGKISSYFYLQPDVDRERQKIKSKRLKAVLQKLSAPNTEETLNGEEEEEEEEDSLEQTKERKGHENQPMKENSRKQSKQTVRRGSDPDYSSNIGIAEDISDSNDSDGGPDKASVGRIAKGFESDRGRHVWIGKTNQRKLFAKNNKGYGRSWQKHTWQDEDEDDPTPSESTGHVAEDETAAKEDVKPDSYWEDQISDTEYDVDELVSAASVAGKMIGGARASRIMTNLEKTYKDEGDEDGGGGDREKEEDGQAGRRKTKTRSKRGKSGRQEVPVNDGKRGTGRSKQRIVKGRATRGDGEESDEECVGQKKVPERKQQRENDDEDYRIEDEREPERNEEDVHIQAKRRAKRNPYLRKQPPSKVEPALEKRKKSQTVGGEVDQKRKDVEDVDEQNIGKAKRKSGKQSNKKVYGEDEDEDYRIEDERKPERDEEDLRIQANRRAKRNPYLKKQPPSKVEQVLEKRKKIQTVEGEVDQKRKDVEDVDEQNIGKAKQQNVKQSNKKVYDEDEDYRIEDEREPERDEEDLRIQANRRAKRNPYLRKQPQRVTKPTVEFRFNDDVDINQEKEKIFSPNVKEGKLSQGKRKSGSSRDTVHANKESVLHPRVVSPGKGKRGRGRGKGKQLLNRKTRFKSSTYGPALSESSDED